VGDGPLNALIGSVVIGGSAGSGPPDPPGVDGEKPGINRLWTRVTGGCPLLAPAAAGGGAAPGWRKGAPCCVPGITRGEPGSNADVRCCPGVTTGGLAAGVRALSLNGG
jgi:hypothetical protein